MLDAVMLLQIHDELIFEVARADLDAVARIVKHEMEHAYELAVPLEATLKTEAQLGSRSTVVEAEAEA